MCFYVLPQAAPTYINVYQPHADINYKQKNRDAVNEIAWIEKDLEKKIIFYHFFLLNTIFVSF